MQRLNLIWEIANTHAGRTDYLISLVSKTQSSLVGYLKFQVYKSDEIVPVFHERFEHFENQSFDLKTWVKIISSIKDVNRVVFDVFGQYGLEVAQATGVKNFKVHATDFFNIELIKKILILKPNILFVSLAGINPYEIFCFKKLFQNVKTKIIFCCGHQEYPTSLENSGDKKLNFLLKNDILSPSDLCLSEHIAHSNYAAFWLPLHYLTNLGTFVEKHICLDRASTKVDEVSALTVDQAIEFENAAFHLANEFSSLSLSSGEIKYRQEVVKTPLFDEKGNFQGYKRRSDSSNSKFSFMPVGFYKFNSKTAYEIFDEKMLCTSMTNIFAKNVAVVVVRTGSKRLPGKCMKRLPSGKTVMEVLCTRLSKACNAGVLDAFVLATTNMAEDDALVQELEKHAQNIYRGDSADVLSRMLEATMRFPSCEKIIRITGDDILFDYDSLQKTLDFVEEVDLTYCAVKDVPSGFDYEVFNKLALSQFYLTSGKKVDTEYLTDFFNHLEGRKASYISQKKYMGDIRFTLDTQSDLDALCELESKFGDLSEISTSVLL